MIASCVAALRQAIYDSPYSGFFTGVYSFAAPQNVSGSICVIYPITSTHDTDMAGGERDDMILQVSIYFDETSPWNGMLQMDAMRSWLRGQTLEAAGGVVCGMYERSYNVQPAVNTGYEVLIEYRIHAEEKNL